MKCDGSKPSSERCLKNRVDSQYIRERTKLLSQNALQQNLTTFSSHQGKGSSASHRWEMLTWRGRTRRCTLDT